MTEHGEKRIFGAICAFRFRSRFLGGLVKAGIIDREGRSMREFFRQREFVGTANSTRTYVDHHDRPQDPIVGPERDRDKRFRRERTNPVTIRFVRINFAQFAVVKVANHLRLPGFQNVSAADFRGVTRGEFFCETFHRRLLREIAVSDRDLAHRAFLLSGEHDTEVRHARHDELSEIAKSFVVIERAGQDVAGIGEKGEPFLTRFRFRARGLFANQLFAFFRLPFYLLGLFEQVYEDRDLCPEDFRHDRRKNIIDRAERIAARDVRLGVVHRADENDRDRLGARPLPD